MKSFKSGLLFVLFFSSHVSCKNLLLIDSSQGEKYQYKSFIEVAKSSGLNFEYLPISSVIDSYDYSFTDKVDGAFFIFSRQLLKQPNSLVASKFFDLLEKFVQKEGVYIGIMLPYMSNINLIRKIFKSLEIENTNPANMGFIQLTHKFLQSPPELKPKQYETMLLPKRIRKVGSLEQEEGESTHIKTALLPLSKIDSSIKELWPFGIYRFNKQYNNHLLIASSSLLNFASITENFRIMPMDQGFKNKILSGLQKTLLEFSNAIKTKGIQLTNLNNAVELPKIQIMRQKSTGPKIKCAWSGTELFEDDKNRQQQKQLIDYIINSRLTHLWLTTSPNWYYSPIATRTKQKEKLLYGLASFTKQLREKAVKSGQAVPNILLSFEIANNLYESNLPENYAVDLYGNKYKDVPSPLNEKFWENEIVVSLKEFLEDWNKISGGIPISGIVLDLEMYGRKTTESFLSTMGFDSESFERFTGFAENDVNGIMNGLAQGKECGKYFEFLEACALALGKHISSSINQLIPNCIFGCYSPSILTSWFYKGLYQGLSRNSKQPLLLFTFNSQFYPHKKWFSENKIAAKHAGAILLSKVESEKDFSKVDYMLKNHDGFWLNRFQWLATPYDENAWYKLEETPMNENQRTQFINYLRNK